MTVQITIIGLGQVGSSIGLALAPHKTIKRVGNDKNLDTMRAAQKAGAVDETKINLPSSVSDANVVLLCIPLNEIEETLEVIAPDLREGTVILDTAPSKATVAAWVEKHLPEGRHYIGLTPAVGAEYLHGIDLGVEAARADLFQKGSFLINTPRSTPGEAVKLATDLCELLGAGAVFSDATEVDGLLASTHILPQLIGAALLDSTIDQPGWNEGQRMAARPYATATAAFAYHDEIDLLGTAALRNRENVVRVIDAYIASLKELRDKIGAGDETSVAIFLDDAFKARARWLSERTRADWDGVEREKPIVPSFGERLSQMFTGKFSSKKK
ncbi:MAG: prephenate dehydrogenase [Anaerolineales bacterium]